MTKNKDSPKHSPLSHPINRPHPWPVLKHNRNNSQQQNDQNVPEDITEWPVGVLDPTVVGNGGADVRHLERRRRAWVELVVGRRWDRHCWLLLRLRVVGLEGGLKKMNENLLYWFSQTQDERVWEVGLYNGGKCIIVPLWLRNQIFLGCFGFLILLVCLYGNGSDLGWV